MAVSMTVAHSGTLNGHQGSQNRTITGDGLITKNVSLARAKTGDLTVRTSSTAGTLTLEAGHGVVATNLLDVYWADGSRLGMVAGTIATNSVPISGGTGDNLPLAGVLITAMIPQLETLSIPVPGNVVGIVANTTAGRAGLIVRNNLSATVVIIKPTITVGYTWDNGDGNTAPLTPGTPIQDVYVSHSDGVLTQDVNLILLTS